MRESAFVLGKGGFAREVSAWALRNDWFFNGYVDKDDEFTFIKQSEAYYKATGKTTNLFLGFGSPKIKKAAYEKFSAYEFFNFPNLIDKSVILASSQLVNTGIILCPNVVVTTNVRFGKCVTVNLSCTIGHDVIIDDYVSLMPQVAISGGVHLAEESYVGVAGVILENMDIGTQSVVGGNALVCKYVDDKTIVVGVPAKPIGNEI